MAAGGSTARSVPRFLTTHYRESGTRFLVFPQLRTLSDFADPVLVYVDTAPGNIGPGPEDERMYVVDAIGKRPYFENGVQRTGPPYRGRTSGRVAAADGAGHFDHIKPVARTDREFSAAMMYAAIRCTLTVWEHYLGRRVPWYFREDYPRLEVIPRVASSTAYSRPGYIECGYDDPGRRSGPFAENFDIVSHEVGHMILREVVGHPRHPEAVECRAREEASADLVAMVALLHFEAAVKHLLDRTHGDLFSANVLSRIGELSEKRTVRRAFSDATLQTIAWDPNPDSFRYALAAPLIAGSFNILVLMYQDALTRRGAIPRSLARASVDTGRTSPDIQRQFQRHYRDRAPLFTDALIEARDRFAMLLARAWQRTETFDLYPRVARTMISVGREIGGNGLARTVRDCLSARHIAPAPDAPAAVRARP